MSAPTIPSLFFLSYARNDTNYQPDSVQMRRFVDDLSARVARNLGVSREGICYFDEGSIQTGTFWTPHLAKAVGTIPVAVTLYSPSYFGSPWCGKEFAVFKSRVRFDPENPQKPTGIVPVRWMKCSNVPPVAEAIQYNHNAFPPEYLEVGLDQLLALKVYCDHYQKALTAIAGCIVTAAQTGLTSDAAVDLETVRSAWELEKAADPDSHKKGGITKTCFVFASDKGWAWTPYPEQSKKIGVMAQKITADLDLYYQEIPCDASLAVKLKETREASIPTILFTDPESLQNGIFAPSLRDYDDMYLPNCGAVVPWSDQSKTAGDTDPRWKQLQDTICRTKTHYPPPNHEWRSIFSQQDLELKTRSIIDDIRSRLLGEICSEQRANGNGAASSKVMKVEDAGLTSLAAAAGIQTASAPQLEAPSK